ncbi:MAG: hypothetical protein A4E32_01165 [Methanomassiliicoccales archaeon PtaU1.Bin124]|nr:MAG: hypothetical protein A4E32_01165 [Methanomassiliicoccales archaeon PtaU1.Bin124]
MTAKVKVNMRLCGKTHLITVDSTDEGNYRVNIETDCANVREFSEGLNDLSMSDLTDKLSSKVVSRYQNCRMSANCLAPAGVLSAAWVEAGMIARSNAKRNKCNDVEFLE